MSREHTAEHVLMGSLQRIKGSFKVRKVEVYDGFGKVFIEIDSLSFEDLAKAQVIANKVIFEGRVVKEHFFDSLEEAQKAFPSLRAHEERIQGRVRVVEVDGFDYSACTGKHVENTKDCGMILVTHVSKSGGEYQIDFEVGEKALETAVKLSTLCLSISSILGTPIKNLEKAVLNMRSENEDLKKRISVITEDSVKKTLSEESLGETKLYAAILKGVDTKAVMKTIGELIGKNNYIYVIGLEWYGVCNILIGSGDERINATHILKELCRVFNGKGGGDNKIAIGSFPCEKLHDVFEEAKKIVRDVLKVQ
ncbi:MAG: DHHA1 domain-containing protein [Crenarchaeota archaeon]|nr:DHHA1 domain-containing protein [Thermoproteota archaeon]MDW8033594.1 DHHA1 domain-containing protein [Nitrososphaerota archaeon]